jgi:hypothetical protein
MQAAIDTLETFWPTRDNFFEVIRNLSYVWKWTCSEDSISSSSSGSGSSVRFLSMVDTNDKFNLKFITAFK